MTDRFRYSRNLAALGTLLFQVPRFWWRWAEVKAAPGSFIIGAVVGFLLSFLILYYWPLGRKAKPSPTKAEIDKMNDFHRLKVAEAAFLSGGIAIGNVDDDGNLTIQVHKLHDTKSNHSYLPS